MKTKIILSLLVLALSACASLGGSEPNRTIAQLAIDHEATLRWQEKIFQDLLSSPTPSADFLRQMDRLTSLYFRAQKFLMDFDQEQASGDLNALNRSEPYSKLQVIRVLQEQQSELLVFLYGRLVDLKKSGNPDESKKAGAVLSNFGRYMLMNRNKLNRLAMQEFVRDLRLARAGHDKQSADLDPVTFRTPEEITNFLGEKEGELSRRDALAAAAQREAAQKDAEFDEAFAQFAASATRGAARDPQAQINFFPNTGPTGNLFGHELPIGTFALTFDDGPSWEWTPQILQELHKNGQRTTFFWLAKNLRSHGMDEIVQMARNDGHTLGNHSYTHADLSKAGVDIQKEVVESTEVDKEIYGFRPSYFRCPYGSCIYKNVASVRKAIADLRMLHVTWSIDSLDWQDKDPASVYKRVIRQVERNGRGIILFHDIHPQSFSASRAVMRYFRDHKDELKLRTISQIVRELNSLPQQEMPAVFKWLPWGKSE